MRHWHPFYQAPQDARIPQVGDAFALIDAKSNGTNLQPKTSWRGAFQRNLFENYLPRGTRRGTRDDKFAMSWTNSACRLVPVLRKILDI